MADPSTNSPATSQPKRRWFRYSLRTFLIVVTVCGVWLGWKLRAAREQQRAVATVRELGGSVKYDYEDGSTGLLLEPPWLLELLGRDFFHNVVSVDLYAQPFDQKNFGKVFPLLRKLPRLRRLSVEAGTIHDDDLQHLSDLKDLKSLYLPTHQLTGEGFKYLADLTTLEYLFVNGNPLDDQGLKGIAELPNVVSLGLNETGVTDSCIPYLTKMHKLSYLNISGTHISADGARRLKALRPDLAIDCSRDQKPAAANVKSQ
jgi:Leucine Rich repeat